MPSSWRVLNSNDVIYKVEAFRSLSNGQVMKFTFGLQVRVQLKPKWLRNVHHPLLKSSDLFWNRNRGLHARESESHGFTDRAMFRWSFRSFAISAHHAMNNGHWTSGHPTSDEQIRRHLTLATPKECLKPDH